MLYAILTTSWSRRSEKRIEHENERKIGILKARQVSPAGLCLCCDRSYVLHGLDMEPASREVR